MENYMYNCAPFNADYMKEYREAVESYADRKENYLFHNQGSEHAKIIFENMFRTAENHIRIAAESLWNDSVVNTPEYLAALSLFLDRPNSKLDILLINEPEIGTNSATIQKLDYVLQDNSNFILFPAVLPLNTIILIFVHPLNAYEPIDVIVFGNVNVFKPVNPLNAYSSIV